MDEKKTVKRAAKLAKKLLKVSEKDGYSPDELGLAAALLQDVVLTATGTLTMTAHAENVFVESVLHGEVECRG